MADEARNQRIAQKVIWLARDGVPVPEEAISWALRVSGDLEGPAYADAQLWQFLACLEGQQ